MHSPCGTVVQFEERAQSGHTPDWLQNKRNSVDPRSAVWMFFKLQRRLWGAKYAARDCGHVVRRHYVMLCGGLRAVTVQ
jgi:hypothetical protein